MELRLAARGLARTPLWTLGLVATIALGIGSTTAVEAFARGLGSADGMAEIAALLRLAALAVFAIAGANVASFLLARATARATETAVRVAIGARRRQLVRHALADSLLIAIVGSAFGGWLAWLSGHILPAALFSEDANRMVFAIDAPTLAGVVLICLVITVLCGLLPVIESRDDRPGTVMRRESSGPSPSALRIGTGLVMLQMAGCTILVISAGVLLAGFRSSLQTAAGLRLSSPAVASLESLQTSSKAIQMSNGLSYFAAAERAAREVAGATSVVWASTVPGNRPNLRTYELESAGIPTRAAELASIPFSGKTLDRIAMPPAAGRLFGTVDSGPCSGVILSTEAAAMLGGDTILGRSIELPSGQWADVIGVVRPLDEPKAARVYRYGDVREGPEIYRVPQLGASRKIELDTNIVSPGYFEFMGLRVVAGRAFDQTHGACRVGIVNEEAAAQLFGGEAVGAAIIDRNGQRTTIIGVVTSSKLRVQQRAVQPMVYLPHEQDFIPRMTMLMETGGSNAATLRQLHLRLRRIPGGREDRIIVTTLFDHMSRTAFAPERIATVLVTTLAAIAMALGGLALHGLMSDATRRRQREIALRIALGAQARDVFRQVIGEGARQVVTGTVVGTIASMVVARWISSITPPHDGISVWTWLVAPFCLSIAVLVASILPARKAVATDPLIAMRVE